MTSTETRSQLGWAVPADDWQNFVDYVVEKWGSAGPNVRYELERAMEEFLDRDDDLEEAERLLRDALDVRGLSSSIIEDALTRDVDSEAKRQVGYRVRTPLKEEFTAFVSEEFNDDAAGQYGGLTSSYTTYGEALTAAINEYRDGGTSRRVRELVEGVITGTTDCGRNSESVESTDKSLSTDTDSSTTVADTATEDDDPTVEAEIVLAVAKELPDEFPESELRGAVAEELNARGIKPGDKFDQYCDAVLEQTDVVEHPNVHELYISPGKRERMTVWDDLNRELRTARLRRLAAGDAARKNKTRHQLSYRDVIELFEDDLGGGPSHQYAYELMEAAAEGRDGFNYGDAKKGKRLRVNLSEVDHTILTDAPDHFSELDADTFGQPAAPAGGRESSPTTAVTDGGIPTQTPGDD